MIISLKYLLVDICGMIIFVFPGWIKIFTDVFENTLDGDLSMSVYRTLYKSVHNSVQFISFAS